MAKLKEFNEEAWNAWVSERPDKIQKMCQQWPAGRLYRLKSSGHRVTLYSYSEDGTVTVKVIGKFNAVAFDRNVFGVNPEDLEECDFPVPGELVGTKLTDPKVIEDLCATLRPLFKK